MLHLVLLKRQQQTKLSITMKIKEWRINAVKKEKKIQNKTKQSTTKQDKTERNTLFCKNDIYRKKGKDLGKVLCIVITTTYISIGIHIYIQVF